MFSDWVAVFGNMHVSSKRTKLGGLIMDKNRNLEVGDKVCEVTSHISGTMYNFSEVTRVTKTQAILKNGEKYHRQGYISGFDGDTYIQWDNMKHWSISHLEMDRPILRKYATDQKHEQNINNFWHDFKPTFEQKEKIYELFKNKEK